MGNFYLDNDDLRFYVERGIDWAPIVGLTEMGFGAPGGFTSVQDAVEFYRDTLQMVGEFVADEVAPHAAEIDREGVLFEKGEARFPKRLDGIFKKLRELEVHGLCVPREFGGMNAPLTVYFLQSELLGRADVSVMSHHGFHCGIAMAMLILSVMEGSTTFDAANKTFLSTRFEKEIREIIKGKAWGCMDITEPDAGSDMAALRAVGEQDDAGRWFLTGQKIFITSGHGKYHFVIARTENKPSDQATHDDPMAGLGGLSMFLVKTYDDNADGTKTWHSTFERIEEKLGHHGSVTATQSFDRTPAELVGERGEGFKYMLMLMNSARLGVGFESIGLGESAYRLAKAYAAERRSMGKAIGEHEMIADYLDGMRTDLQGLRALAVYGAVEQELGEKESIRLRFTPPADEVECKRVERRANRHKANARRVTPLVKYLGAEKSVELARRCLQVHGGNGYIKEYPAEKLLRDSLVMPIYEGTSQIQALMAMKDTIGGILKGPKAFVSKLAQARWRSLSARDELERRVAKVQVISLAAQQHLLTRTATDKVRSLNGRPIATWPDAFLKHWDPKRDFAFAMLHAERLTRILADEAICTILLDQAKAHADRREVLERWLERCEPRVRYLSDEIHTTGARLLAALDEQSAARGTHDARDIRQG